MVTDYTVSGKPALERAGLRHPVREYDEPQSMKWVNQHSNANGENRLFEAVKARLMQSAAIDDL